jgi:L-galactono-1,4-lactone dehydrogenase
MSVAGDVCRDIKYMQELLSHIEAAGIAAPSPIEQRWTAASSSPMSPAAAAELLVGSKGSSKRQQLQGRRQLLPHDTVFSWVGIIMYLPCEDPEQRAAITQR